MMTRHGGGGRGRGGGVCDGVMICKLHYSSNEVCPTKPRFLLNVGRVSVIRSVRVSVI